VNFRNKIIFYGEEFLAPRPTPKLEDHPLSAVRDLKLLQNVVLKNPIYTHLNGGVCVRLYIYSLLTISGDTKSAISC
jgi:hypothetical protein